MIIFDREFTKIKFINSSAIKMVMPESLYESHSIDETTKDEN